MASSMMYSLPSKTCDVRGAEPVTTLPLPSGAYRTGMLAVQAQMVVRGGQWHSKGTQRHSVVLSGTHSSTSAVALTCRGARACRRPSP